MQILLMNLELASLYRQGGGNRIDGNGNQKH